MAARAGDTSRARAPRRVRRAQALVELAIGMFVVSLVLASLFAFTRYILASLEMQRTIRAEAGRGAFGAHGADESYSSAVRSETITVSPLAAEYVFGSRQVKIKEEVHIPLMGVGL